MIYKIDENLFQGSVPKDPTDLYCLVEKKRKIDAIINLMSLEEEFYFKPQVDAYLHLPIYDGPNPGIQWLKMAIGIATHLREKYPLLIHCYAGISRSTTLTAAVLMQEKKWKMDKALEYIAVINPSIDPARNFLKLLKEFEKEI